MEQAVWDLFGVQQLSKIERVWLVYFPAIFIYIYFVLFISRLFAIIFSWRSEKLDFSSLFAPKPTQVNRWDSMDSLLIASFRTTYLQGTKPL